MSSALQVLKSAGHTIEELSPVKANKSKRTHPHKGSSPQGQSPQAVSNTKDAPQLTGSASAPLLSEVDAKGAKSYAGRVVDGQFYRNPATCAEDFSEAERTQMLRDFEQTRAERVQILLEKQKRRDGEQRVKMLEEKKKQEKQHIDMLKDEEHRKNQKVQKLSQWCKEKEVQAKEREEFHNKVMKDLVDKQTRQAEKTQATEQRRQVERETRLKIGERQKMRLQQQVSQCSQSSGSSKDKHINNVHHHHHHHMHYYHGAGQPQDTPNSEGQQGVAPPGTLSIEAQQRFEAQSENMLRQECPTRSFLQEQRLGSQMAQTAPADAFSNAAVDTIQRSATVAGLPRIPGRPEIPQNCRPENSKYNQTLRRAMGAYGDSGRPHFLHYGD